MKPSQTKLDMVIQSQAEVTCGKIQERIATKIKETRIQGVVYRGLPTSDRIKVLWFAYQYDTAQVIKEIK